MFTTKYLIKPDETGHKLEAYVIDARLSVVIRQTKVRTLSEAFHFLTNGQNATFAKIYGKKEKKKKTQRAIKKAL